VVGESPEFREARERGRGMVMQFRAARARLTRALLGISGGMERREDDDYGGLEEEEGGEGGAGTEYWPPPVWHTMWSMEAGRQDASSTAATTETATPVRSILKKKRATQPVTPNRSPSPTRRTPSAPSSRPWVPAGHPTPCGCLRCSKTATPVRSLKDLPYLPEAVSDDALRPVTAVRVSVSPAGPTDSVARQLAHWAAQRAGRIRSARSALDLTLRLPREALATAVQRAQEVGAELRAQQDAHRELVKRAARKEGRGIAGLSRVEAEVRRSVFPEFRAMIKPRGSHHKRGDGATVPDADLLRLAGLRGPGPGPERGAGAWEGTAFKLELVTALHARVLAKVFLCALRVAAAERRGRAAAAENVALPERRALLRWGLEGFIVARRRVLAAREAALAIAAERQRPPHARAFSRWVRYTGHRRERAAERAGAEAKRSAVLASAAWRAWRERLHEHRAQELRKQAADLWRRRSLAAAAMAEWRTACAARRREGEAAAVLARLPGARAPGAHLPVPATPAPRSTRVMVDLEGLSDSLLSLGARGLCLPQRPLLLDDSMFSVDHDTRREGLAAAPRAEIAWVAQRRLASKVMAHWMGRVIERARERAARAHSARSLASRALAVWRRAAVESRGGKVRLMFSAWRAAAREQAEQDQALSDAFRERQLLRRGLSALARYRVLRRLKAQLEAEACSRLRRARTRSLLRAWADAAAQRADARAAGEVVQITRARALALAALRAWRRALRQRVLLRRALAFADECAGWVERPALERAFLLWREHIADQNPQRDAQRAKGELVAQNRRYFQARDHFHAWVIAAAKRLSARRAFALRWRRQRPLAAAFHALKRNWQLALYRQRRSLADHFSAWREAVRAAPAASASVRDRHLAHAALRAWRQRLRAKLAEAPSRAKALQPVLQAWRSAAQTSLLKRMEGAARLERKTARGLAVKVFGAWKKAVKVGGVESGVGVGVGVEVGVEVGVGVAVELQDVQNSVTASRANAAVQTNPQKKSASTSTSTAHQRQPKSPSYTKVLHKVIGKPIRWRIRHHEEEEDEQ
jgi:hypothetical protein